MVTRSSTMKQKGQITVPVEIRRKHDLHTGSQLVFEDRGDYFAVIPVDALVDRTAGALAEYAKNMPLLTPAEMREAAAEAIAEENLDTLRQIDQDRENH